MADIDVQSIALASPPAVAYQQQYTPGILVRNNGVDSATAAGYLQCYNKATGQLLFTWQVQSGSISPGNEGTATSGATLDLSGYAPGTELLFSGLVTTQNDQVPANDPLQPVTVVVQEGESPEPPTVPAHSSQHEDGGADELDLDGMHGTLADPQAPTAHVFRHEEGGDDELDVTGLPGQLADAQTPAVHGNARHDTNYATSVEIANGIATHNAAATVHSASTNLEQVAHKDIPNGYPSLDEFTLVPAAVLGSGVRDGTKFLRDDRTWQLAPVTGLAGPFLQWRPGRAVFAGTGPGALAQNCWPNIPGGLGPYWRAALAPNSSVVIQRGTIEADYVQDSSAVATLDAEFYGQLNDVGPGDSVACRIYWNPQGSGQGVVRTDIIWIAGTPAETMTFHCRTQTINGESATGNQMFGVGNITVFNPGSPGSSAEHNIPTVLATAGVPFLSNAYVFAVVNITGGMDASNLFLRWGIDWRRDYASE